MIEMVGVFVRKEGNKTILRPYKPTERAREEIEKKLKEKGYVYIGYTSISSNPCDYRFETEVLEAQDIVVIDLTTYDGPRVYVDKYYYVKPPAKAVFRDYDIWCGPDGPEKSGVIEYLIEVDESGKIEKKRIK
jgi:hypothetical protein